MAETRGEGKPLVPKGISSDRHPRDTLFSHHFISISHRGSVCSCTELPVDVSLSLDNNTNPLVFGTQLHVPAPQSIDTQQAT